MCATPSVRYVSSRCDKRLCWCGIRVLLINDRCNDRWLTIHNSVYQIQTESDWLRHPHIRYSTRCSLYLRRTERVNTENYRTVVASKLSKSRMVFRFGRRIFIPTCLPVINFQQWQPIWCTSSHCTTGKSVSVSQSDSNFKNLSTSMS